MRVANHYINNQLEFLYNIQILILIRCFILDKLYNEIKSQLYK